MTFYRPKALKTALEIRAKTNAKVLAGGTDIYPALEGQELQGDVLDITAIPDLKQVTQRSDGWHIGAACTWSQLANATLPTGFAALQQAAKKVGSLQIQNAGTIAGNICNASPAADGVPPLLVMDCEVKIASLGGKRQVPLGDFIQGVRKIDLQPEEIVTGIFIPAASTTGHSDFEKLGARNHLVISISMVAVRLELREKIITDISIAVGSSSPAAIRMSTLEKSLIGHNIKALGEVSPLVKREVDAVLSPIADIRGDAQYRNAAAVELIERAINRAVGRASL